MKIKKYKSGEIGYWRTSLTLGALILTQLMTYGAIKYKTADKITSYFVPTGGDEDNEVVDRTEPEKKPPPPVVPDKIIMVEDNVVVTDTANMSTEGHDTAVAIVKTLKKKKKKKAKKEKVWVRVQKMPQFPGGPEALAKFLGDNLIYPEDANDMQLTKKVFINFLVTKTGAIEKIRILTSKDDYGFTEEAERVMKIIARKFKYSPGIQGNKAVPVSYTLPIIFVPGDDDDDF